jgi:hypothetical protein
MVALWILLLALVVFFMYVYTRTVETVTTSGCGTCSGKKNVPAVE